MLNLMATVQAFVGVAETFGCCGFTLIPIAIVVAVVIGLWKVYAKAGEPGWAAIVPIYNLIVLLKIVDRPLWWIILYFLPLINIVASFFVSVDLAKKFGKDTGYGIGIFLLPIVFVPMLGFGDAQYQGHGPIKEGFSM